MQEEIIAYISKATNYGLNVGEIKQHLLVAGWSEPEINEAFKAFDAFNRQAQGEDNFAFHPAIEVKTSITETVNKPIEITAKKTRKLNFKKLAIAIPIVLVVFVGLVYLLVFRNVSIAGNSVFSLLASQAEKNAHKANSTIFELSYTDPESFSSGALGEGIEPVTLKSLQINVKNTNIVDSQNASEGQTTLNFVNNDQTYNASVEYKYINQELYLKLAETGQNTFLSDFSKNTLGQDIANNWLKFKIGDNESVKIENKVNLREISESLLSKGALTPKLKGVEKINGHYSLHYQIEVNKEALAKIITEQLPSNDSAPSQLISNEDKETIQSVLNGLQIPSLEVWFGIRDLALKKLHVGSNAPSIASLAELSVTNYTQGLAKNNDDQRLSDIRQVTAALELFYNDNKGYPEGATGLPQNLFPKYLPAMPPSAPASGNCSDFYNTYWYKHQGDAKTSPSGSKVYSSYTLTFCLGNDTAGFKAGLGLAGPTGITTTVACPDQVNPCFLEKSRQNPNPENVSNLISNVKFTGSLSWTYLPDSIKEVKKIVVPENSLDFTGILGGQQVQPN